MNKGTEKDALHATVHCSQKRCSLECQAN
jgi:hypothetical protein